MNQVENSEVKLFAFKINYTAAAILFLITFQLLIGTLPTLFVMFYSFGQSISLLLTEPFNVLILNLISFLLIIASAIIYIYILIECSKARLQRKTQEKQIRWFGFELTKTSSVIIGLLSILGIITITVSGFTLIASVIESIYLVHYIPMMPLLLYILTGIVDLILLVIYIPSIIICRKAILVLTRA
ncbi:MAG: hypothetical protein ACFFD7_10280 [Candidatus Thorarchaeota archaeon]